MLPELFIYAPGYTCPTLLFDKLIQYLNDVIALQDFPWHSGLAAGTCHLISHLQYVT